MTHTHTHTHTRDIVVSSSLAHFHSVTKLDTTAADNSSTLSHALLNDLVQLHGGSGGRKRMTREDGQDKGRKVQNGGNLKTAGGKTSDERQSEIVARMELHLVHLWAADFYFFEEKEQKFDVTQMFRKSC